MAKRKLEGKKVKEKIAQALVGGQSQAAVARSLGVNQSTISRLVSKEDVKALVQAETMKLAEAVPQAVENIKDLVYEMPEIPKKDTKRRELSFKAATKLLESFGMLNSPSPSPTFVNIVSTGQPLIDPVVLKIIERYSNDLRSDDEPEIDRGSKG